jgi:hypothetical protein
MAFFEKSPEARPEDGGQGVDGNEEIGIGFTPGAIGRESAAGDQEMDVGMVFELPGPGVEYGGDAGHGAEPARIGAHVEERGGGGAKEKRQQFTRMGSDGSAQGFGHGEGGQVVGDRQQEVLLPVTPGMGVIGTAGRAMAVAAGVEGEVLLSTLRAKPELATHGRSTAGGDIPQSAELIPAHAVAELTSILRAMATDDVRHRWHLQVCHQGADLLGGGIGGLLGHMGVDRSGARRSKGVSPVFRG